MIKKFKDFVIDPMNFGFDDLKLNTVHLSKLESSWGDDDYVDNLKEYVIYLGPVDSEDTLSHFSFSDDFLKELFYTVGIKEYYLNSSECSHTLYFENTNDADFFFNELKQLIALNYKIVD